MDTNFRRKILEDLRSSDLRTVEDAIMRCASCFEQYFGHPQPMHEEIKQQAVTPEDVAVLRQCLISIASSQPATSLGGTAIFALGKLNDPALRDMLESCLRQQAAAVRSTSGSLFQTIITLQNSGVSVNEERRSWSVLEIDANLNDTLTYLRSRDAAT